MRYHLKKKEKKLPGGWSRQECMNLRYPFLRELAHLKSLLVWVWTELVPFTSALFMYWTNTLKVP